MNCERCQKRKPFYHLDDRIWALYFKRDAIVCLECAEFERGEPFPLMSFVWCPATVELLVGLGRVSPDLGARLGVAALSEKSTERMSSRVQALSYALQRGTLARLREMQK